MICPTFGSGRPRRVTGLAFPHVFATEDVFVLCFVPFFDSHITAKYRTYVFWPREAQKSVATQKHRQKTPNVCQEAPQKRANAKNLFYFCDPRPSTPIFAQMQINYVIFEIFAPPGLHQAPHQPAWLMGADLAPRPWQRRNIGRRRLMHSQLASQPAIKLASHPAILRNFYMSISRE